MHLTPRAELESQIRKLQAHLAANDLDGALILQNTTFSTSAAPSSSRTSISLLMTRKSLVRARQESALDKAALLRHRV